jgi:hypothetical protein
MKQFIPIFLTICFLFMPISTAKTASNPNLSEPPMPPEWPPPDRSMHKHADTRIYVTSFCLLFVTMTSFRYNVADAGWFRHSIHISRHGYFCMLPCILPLWIRTHTGEDTGQHTEIAMTSNCWLSAWDNAPRETYHPRHLIGLQTLRATFI